MAPGEVGRVSPRGSKVPSQDLYEDGREEDEDEEHVGCGRHYRVVNALKWASREEEYDVEKTRLPRSTSSMLRLSTAKERSGVSPVRVALAHDESKDVSRHAEDVRREGEQHARYEEAPNKLEALPIVRMLIILA